ncbi:MAG: rod shape-determining protein MreC [candidate division WOR-3 bacterium]|nr:MAG: rod shape-determining protein MreC [candidate division WOR-3 bacterium]
MRRQQIILFVLLLVVSIVPHFLSEGTNLVVSRNISWLVLFPVRITTNLFEYLTISATRIERLEILVTQIQLENALLKDRLDSDTTTLESEEHVLLKATVIGRDPLNINGYLHIDKGTNHGVTANQPAVSVYGFVGKVKHAGPLSSIVETVENYGFTVSAIDVNTGIHGMIRKKENLMFLYVRRNDQISVGDSIMTSGMSEIFPKGILIGTVHAISESDNMFFKDVYVTPAAPINRLVSTYIIQSRISVRPGN